MNISINSLDFDIHNVSFLEPKKNILMEGYFTKINYLSQWFTMSGLFFYLPIKIKSINHQIPRPPKVNIIRMPVPILRT